VLLLSGSLILFEKKLKRHIGACIPDPVTGRFYVNIFKQLMLQQMLLFGTKAIVFIPGCLVLNKALRSSIKYDFK